MESEEFLKILLLGEKIWDKRYGKKEPEDRVQARELVFKELETRIGNDKLSAFLEEVERLHNFYHQKD